MKLEVIGKGFLYRWPGGEVRLEPGKPIELPPDRASKLMARVPGRVRLVERPNTVYFFRESARAILGPARVDFVSQTGEGPQAEYWLFVTYDGLPTSINATQLRSQRDFETQTRLKPVEPIREHR